MIWKNNPSIEVLNNMAKGNMLEHLGIKITEIGPDFIKATMPVDHRTKQPMGLLHGGASVALSESMGSFASVLILDNPSEYSIVGIEINANHLKAVRSGSVYSITKPIRIGRKIQVWNTEIYNHEDQLTCTSRLTTMTLENKN
ncbi:MAG: hotdog fold thioesterase [Saprospiraceae bacterium]|nr:hotdog fold thioesterase [Saprospiraceae bacterium]